MACLGRLVIFPGLALQGLAGPREADVEERVHLPGLAPQGLADPREACFGIQGASSPAVEEEVHSPLPDTPGLWQDLWRSAMEDRVHLPGRAPQSLADPGDTDREGGHSFASLAPWAS